MKNLSLIFASFNFAFAAGTNQINSPIWGDARLENIETWHNIGEIFTLLQGGGYFAILALLAALFMIFVFSIHFAIIGAKKFSHDRAKIFAFPTYQRLIHAIAAISWMILIPTGFVMMFGDKFGGGYFVRLCKNLHGIATVAFSIVVLPMFVMWFKAMLPAKYDLKWLLILGGYLSKIKRPVPAGQFNAGQKMWFYLSIFGGLIMIITGAFMYFLDFPMQNIRQISGLSQIDILRLSALIHNALAIVCVAFFLIHVYMSVFAIKGAIHSIITGYKEEEEVEILHSYWYKELKAKGVL